MADTKQVPFYVEFLAGWVGGVGQILSAQPFDIIKIRLQTQSSTAPKYAGTLDCFKKTLLEEGPLSFYKGTVSPLLGVGTICAIQFSAFQKAKNVLNVRAILLT